MNNYLVTYLITNPTVFRLFTSYPSYWISFILAILLVYKFRTTGILLFIHAIAFFIYFHPGIEQEFSNFEPNMWNVPLYGILSIPILLIGMSHYGY